MPRYDYPGYKSTGEGWLGARPGTKGGYHGGTDSPADAGTPVYAEHAGKVFRSGPISGYGTSVIVKSIAPDGTPFYELYGHLGPGPLPDPDTDVVAGKPIPGAVIGTKEYVQSKGGLSTGPHLHREIISGRAKLNPEGALGLYSSEIEHRADPDTFDANHPVFPYENKESLPPPIAPERSRILITPQRPGLSTGPSNKSDMNSRSTQQSEPPWRLQPGMPIPGAVGPTSIGGPDGPTPVVPPALSRPQPPIQLTPRSETILPEQRLNTAPAQRIRPFLSTDPSSSNVSAAFEGTYAPSKDMPFPALATGKAWQNSGPAVPLDAMVDSGAGHSWDKTGGGLPGLLALVMGETLPNPFEQKTPDDAIPVRRLISRPARY